MATSQLKSAVAPEHFREALGHFATGVTVVTVVKPDGQVHGMTANAFSSVSLVPPLVLVCVAHTARTFEFLRGQKRFGVNVLLEQQEAVARYFARPEQPPEQGRRLGIHFEHAEGGGTLLQDCLARLLCTQVAAHEAGDHTIFVGHVEQAAVSDGRPLLFYRGKFGALPPEE